MKIAFVSHPGYAVLPPAGSVEIVTREIARRLADRHDVTIYGSAAPGVHDIVDERIAYRFVEHRADARLARGLRPFFRTRRADRGYVASSLNPVLYWTRVAREIRRSGADVVHVSNQTQALPFLRRANPHARIVLHMHCEWLVQLDARMLDRRLRNADLIVGVSEHIMAPARLRFPRHAARCITIYNGTELPALPEPEAEPATVSLLHVGRISPEKGHHILVAALNDVVRTHPQLRLTIVGEESVVPFDWAVGISSDPLVKDLARWYGAGYLDAVKRRMSAALAERTTFTGRISHTATAEHYARADLFVFPSYFESMGVPPVEAMAAGVPVVAARAGGVGETVRDGLTGLLVDRGDAGALAAAIRTLLDDPARRAAFGAAGRRWAAERFSWEPIAEQWEAALAGPAAAAPVTPGSGIVPGLVPG